MMHYYIDGYNLLFRLHHKEEDLCTTREHVINDLSTVLKFLQINATIVFDAAYQLGESSRSHYQQLEVIYTAEGESADEYILRVVKASSMPSKETIVTSDKKLAWYVRTYSAHTESVESFLKKINQQYKRKRFLKKQSKNKHKQASQPNSPQTSQLKQSSAPPKHVSLEDCTGYYLETFEKEYEKICLQKQTEKIQPSISKRMKKNKKSPSTKAPIDDLSRWLQIFERGLINGEIT